MLNSAEASRHTSHKDPPESKPSTGCFALHPSTWCDRCRPSAKVKTCNIAGGLAVQDDELLVERLRHGI